MTRAMEIVEGAGAAVSFASSGVSFTLEGGALPEKMRQAIDDFGTASNYKAKVLEKQWEFGAFDIVVFGSIDDIYAAYSDNELVTFSAKTRAGTTVSIALQAGVSGVKPGNLEAGAKFDTTLTITPLMQDATGTEVAPVISTGS